MSHTLNPPLHIFGLKRSISHSLKLEHSQSGTLGTSQPDWLCECSRRFCSPACPSLLWLLSSACSGLLHQPSDRQLLQVSVFGHVAPSFAKWFEGLDAYTIDFKNLKRMLRKSTHAPKPSSTRLGLSSPVPAWHRRPTSSMMVTTLLLTRVGLDMWSLGSGL